HSGGVGRITTFVHGSQQRKSQHAVGYRPAEGAGFSPFRIDVMELVVAGQFREAVDHLLINQEPVRYAYFLTNSLFQFVDTYEHRLYPFFGRVEIPGSTFR